VYRDQSISCDGAITGPYEEEPDQLSDIENLDDSGPCEPAADSGENRPDCDQNVSEDSG
jgi:hypothetical protein